MTSVDPVEAARRDYDDAAVVSRMDSKNSAKFSASNGAFDRLRTAILTSDPRVQALEAVARAAEGANNILSELAADPPRDVRATWKRQIIESSLEIDAALAALQEVPGRGEDGDG